MTMIGFAETVSINEAESAVVAVRRGEPASLRFPDVYGARPMLRSRREWDEFCASARAFAALGQDPPLFAGLVDGRTVEIRIAPARVAALSELLMRACAFLEGMG